MFFVGGRFYMRCVYLLSLLLDAFMEPILQIKNKSKHLSSKYLFYATPSLTQFIAEQQLTLFHVTHTIFY